MIREIIMGNWRETILKEFIPQVARITIVADPDALLSEEGIFQEIQGRGFELIVYEEPITFRYMYESKSRPEWEAGKQNELIILLRGEEDSFTRLPFDIANRARKLKFGLDRLFPQMNRGVLTTLDRSLLDALDQAQALYSPHQLGENATKDFVLRYVFEIAPEMIKTQADLLRILLRKHYRDQKVPALLDEWLIERLKKGGKFADWPLEIIVPDRSEFLAFLQERWPVYLSSLVTDLETAAREFGAAYLPAFPGPAILPFGHDDVRVYIDNLFAEGMLKPVSHPKRGDQGSSGETNRKRFPNWIAMGVQSDPEEERQSRLKIILQAVENDFQPDTASHIDWLNLAPRWAEANALWFSSPKINRQNHAIYDTLKPKYEALRQRIDQSFTLWLQQRYGTLYNLPVSEPVMVHQIPRYMAKYLQSSTPKMALMIIDGLSFEQWVIIRDTLQHQLSDLKFPAVGTFAWIPTLTSVSRQSIFAGKPPMFFPDHIWDTKAEYALWTQFWSDNGLAEHQIYYRRMTVENVGLEEMKDQLSEPQIRVAGLVINKVDKIMHGMELGSAGMLNQVHHWTEQGYLAKLIQFLNENHYQVFISSDHGNIEATGCGSPAEGSTADLRGERARIYTNEALRTSVKTKYPQALEWKPIGLPENYYPLLASGRTAFVQNEKHTVCHGGISLEEVIVPFIRIEKR